MKKKDIEEQKVENEITMEDTVPMMLSDDPKERFKAEYYQLKIRISMLKEEINKNSKIFMGMHGKRSLSDLPSMESLNNQLFYMMDYLHALEERAEYENIEL